MSDEGDEGSLASFQSQVKTGFWLVMFFDNESNLSKRIADAYVDAARSFHGLIKVMAIQYNDEEMSPTPLTKHFRVESTGAIFLYSARKRKDLMERSRFRGDGANMAEISNFAGNSVPYAGALIRNQDSLTRFLITVC